MLRYLALVVSVRTRVSVWLFCFDISFRSTLTPCNTLTHARDLSLKHRSFSIHKIKIQMRYVSTHSHHHHHHHHISTLLSLYFLFFHLRKCSHTHTHTHTHTHIHTYLSIVVVLILGFSYLFIIIDKITLFFHVELVNQNFILI